MRFLVKGKEIDPLTLPHRNATVEERRLMLGSLATLYEMKIPVVHQEGSGCFFPLTELDREIEFETDKGLVVLHTDIELPSIFRKWKKRPKLSKKWQ